MSETSNPNQAQEMVITTGSYKGNPTITLQWGKDSKWPFSFGVAKAKMILAAVDATKAFVEANSKG